MVLADQRGLRPIMQVGSGKGGAEASSRSAVISGFMRRGTLKTGPPPRLAIAAKPGDVGEAVPRKRSNVRRLIESLEQMSSMVSSESVWMSKLINVTRLVRPDASSCDRMRHASTG